MFGSTTRPTGRLSSKPDKRRRGQERPDHREAQPRPAVAPWVTVVCVGAPSGPSFSPSTVDFLERLGLLRGMIGARQPPCRPTSPHPRTPRSSPRFANPTAWPVAQLRRQSRDSRRSRASPDQSHSRLDTRPLDRLGASQNRETVAEDVHIRHRRPEFGRTVDPHPRHAAPQRGILRAEEVRPRSEIPLVHRQEELPHLDTEQAAQVVAL